MGWIMVRNVSQATNVNNNKHTSATGGGETSVCFCPLLLGPHIRRRKFSYRDESRSPVSGVCLARYLIKNRMGQIPAKSIQTAFRVEPDWASL